MEHTILEQLRSEDVWDRVMIKFLKGESLDSNQKLILNIKKKQKFYLDIVDKIKEGTFEWSIPKKIRIPKDNGEYRLVYIHSLEDRFLLSVLNNIYTNVYNDKVSKYVFSYKEGVRTLTAINSIIEDENVFDKYSLKLDISKYFNSVSEESLRNIVDSLTLEQPSLNLLLTKLLFTNRTVDNNKEIDEYMSLIPGCAFSSFLANLTLRDLDEKLGTTENVTYARYSDDMIFFSDSKEKLYELNEEVLTELGKYGLKVNPDKYTFYNPGQKIEFLGMCLYKDKGGKPCVDIKETGMKKIKSSIRVESKRIRKDIEIKGFNRDIELSKFFYKLNCRIYKSYIFNPSKFGWAHYVFSNVNVIDSLRELDFYLKERARYIYTGKNNKQSINKITDERLRELGMESFVEMYIKFNTDRDLYMTKVRGIERSRMYFEEEENEVIDHEIGLYI